MDYVEIEATVVTGLESCAKKDVTQRLNVDAQSGQGRVNFKIPLCDIPKVCH